MLFAGITLLISFKYSLLNEIVKKLKQRSISAGNQRHSLCTSRLVGTSETLCNETVESFTSPSTDAVYIPLEDIKPISNHVPSHLKPISDEQFGHYLAGLIDGDGHFCGKQQLIIVFNSLDGEVGNLKSRPRRR